MLVVTEILSGKYEDDFEEVESDEVSSIHLSFLYKWVVHMS